MASTGGPRPGVVAAVEQDLTEIQELDLVKVVEQKAQSACSTL
ncbi:hypothetical protein [Actinoallomurus acanthiterrae]